MKAVILAGGKGTRLRPFTYAVPKPLLPVNQKPMIEHIINSLKNYGITDIIITLGYLGYQIRNYFGDGSNFGVNITYSEEEKSLGTAGCLAPIKDMLKDDTFLLMAGDNLTNLNFNEFLEFHKMKGGVGTIALVEIDTKIEFGVADLDENQNIVRFKEKPVYKNYASTMIYALEPEVLDYIHEGMDFAKELFPKLLENGKKIYGYVFNDLWVDVGRISDYEKVNSLR